MNCVKVQEAIWCGDLNNEMQQHIATCEACSSEQYKVKALSFSLEDVHVPVQSRSLLPGKREIEQVMRMRKRQRFTKWGVGGVAAVACVLLAVMVLPTFINSTSYGSGANTTASSAIDPAKKTQPTLIYNSQYDSNGYSPSTSKQSQISSQATDQAFVTVDPGADPQYKEESDSVRAYLNKVFDMKLFKHITVTNLIKDSQNCDANNLSFEVSLLIQHQPGQGSAYGSGDVSTTRFAHFTKQQGLWTFDGVLSTSPAFLNQAGNTDSWAIVNSETYYIKVPQNIQATTNTDGSIIFKIQDKAMGSLEIEGQKSDQSSYYDRVMLPNHSTVLSQSTIDLGKPNLHCVQFVLQTDPPAADPNAPSVVLTHTYILDNGKYAYHLKFADGAVDADTLKMIIKSFVTKTD